VDIIDRKLSPLGTDMGGAGSEDCLKINVYAPVGAKSDSNCGYILGTKLPVADIIDIHFGVDSFH
jgi:carboxylesterase type B